MKRRSFFATLFGGLLCEFLPKSVSIPTCPYCKAAHRADQCINPTRVDTLDLSHWGRIIKAENVIFDSVTVMRKRNGYITPIVIPLRIRRGQTVLEAYNEKLQNRNWDRVRFPNEWPLTRG